MSLVPTSPSPAGSERESGLTDPVSPRPTPGERSTAGGLALSHYRTAAALPRWFGGTCGTGSHLRGMAEVPGHGFRPGVGAMSGSVTSQWVMPIVIAAALTFWISIVLYAHRHPKWKHHPPAPKADVAGGCFHASCGRQLEPIPGEPVHRIPAPRAPAAQESYETADLGATAATEPEGAGQQADEARGAGIGLPPR